MLHLPGYKSVAILEIVPFHSSEQSLAQDHTGCSANLAVIGLILVVTLIVESVLLLNGHIKSLVSTRHIHVTISLFAVNSIISVFSYIPIVVILIVLLLLLHVVLLLITVVRVHARVAVLAHQWIRLATTSRLIVILSLLFENTNTNTQSILFR